MITIGPNQGANLAIQTLASTSRNLLATQQAIATGSRVSTVKDNSAVWITANRAANSFKAFDVIKTSTDRAIAILNTAVATGESMLEQLAQIKSNALAASDPSQTPSAKAALWKEVGELTNHILTALSSGNFDEVDMWSAGIWDTALGDESSATNIGIPGDSVGFSDHMAQFPNYVATYSQSDPKQIVNWIENVLEFDLRRLLTRWGADAARLDAQGRSIDKFAETLRAGFNKISDVNYTKTSAKLEALQAKQQLSYSALSIANKSGQAALSLFKTEAA